MITKEDIIEAFAENRSGKLKLLYTYYKEYFDSQEATTEQIAEKISVDMGIVFPLRFIENVKKHILFCRSRKTGLYNYQFDSIIEKYKRSMKNRIINNIPSF